MPEQLFPTVVEVLLIGLFCVIPILAGSWLGHQIEKKFNLNQELPYDDSL